MEQHWQQELLELQRQQLQRSQQLEELLEPPPRSPPQPLLPSPQRPETGEEGLPVYGPPTPAWLRLGGQSPSRLNLGGRTALWLSRARCARLWTLNLRSRVPSTTWMGSPRVPPRPAAVGGTHCRGWDEDGTSSGGAANEIGTWASVDDDGRFPSLVDICLRNGGSLETIQELIRGVKARMVEEMENWGPGWIRLRSSTDP